MSDYRPISCALHSELELAIMRREPLRVVLAGPEGPSEREGVPLDIFARDGAEFLVMGCLDGVRRELQLDALQRVVRVRGGDTIHP